MPYFLDRQDRTDVTDLSPAAPEESLERLLFRVLDPALYEKASALWRECEDPNYAHGVFWGQETLDSPFLEFVGKIAAQEEQTKRGAHGC